VESERVVLAPLLLRSRDVAVDVAGAIGLDPAQTLDLRMGLLAPRAGIRIEGVGDAVLDALTDEEGRVRIPIRVTGPSQTPRVRPDAAALLASARRSGARALGEKASDGVKRLFRRR